jgi:hypothetical protein
LRGLLEAARKLQQEFEDRDVDLHCLVFLRTDIYDHLIRETPDKGKDTAIRLDWDDPAVFEEIVRRRIEASTELKGDLRQLWPQLFESHIGVEDSFNYIVSRTLMRPRDLLGFVQRCIEVALNRGHELVSAEDIKQAERTYSEEVLLTTSFEISDTYPALSEVLYSFHGARTLLTRDEVLDVLTRAGITTEEHDKTLELLLWFDFLGVTAASFSEEMYSYSVQSNVRRLLNPVELGEGLFVIHPAFRAALDTRD